MSRRKQEEAAQDVSDQARQVRNVGGRLLAAGQRSQEAAAHVQAEDGQVEIKKTAILR